MVWNRCVRLKVGARTRKGKRRPLLASPAVAKKKTRVPAPRAPKPKSGDTGAPGRPVQAPTVRGKDKQRPSMLVLGLAAAGLVALVAVTVAFVFLSSNSDPTDESVAAAMRGAGCTYVDRAPRPYPSDHSAVPQPNTPVKWNTFPPAAGAHYGIPLSWSFYREAVRPQQVVHNEEHSGVILWWGPQTPPATVDELERFYQEDPNSMLGTPIDGLGRRVAISAWTIDSPRNYFQDGNLGIGHVAVCPTFNEGAFAKFRDSYRGKGPEGIPARVNTPGS